MTRVVFYTAGPAITGFDMRGHSGAGKAGEDVVCAAVSSAAKADADDGYMRVVVPKGEAVRCQDILKGFRLHMDQLAEQYPHHIQVTDLEV